LGDVIFIKSAQNKEFWARTLEIDWMPDFMVDNWEVLSASALTASVASSADSLVCSMMVLPAGEFCSSSVVSLPASASSRSCSLASWAACLLS